jgi:hypothetical protein
VHVPPPEQEELINRPPPQFRPAQKHYKIVFIKAPTPPTPTAANIQLPGQDEQKTLIYVLVKKPDEAEALNIQQPAPTQPSKPEVYFIKYKTQKQVSFWLRHIRHTLLSSKTAALKGSSARQPCLLL